MAKINKINNAAASLTLDPGASGDSVIQFDINTTGEFRVGVDDTAADAFKLSQGSVLGSNDTLSISADGEVLLPLQPACLLSQTNSQLNVTGDGTVYTIQMSTEVFDQGNNFASNTFTAPVTGYYMVGANRIFLSLGATGGTAVAINYVTSNRTYYASATPGRARLALLGGNNWSHYPTAALCDMDAGDTLTMTMVSTGGSKVDGVALEGMSVVLVA